VHGSDPGLDQAISLHDAMTEFLQQNMYEAAPFEASLQQMVATLQREEVFP
jgi:flagellum-specific ATP synthase